MTMQWFIIWRHHTLPGVLQSMGSWRVGHNLVTKQQQILYFNLPSIDWFPDFPFDGAGRVIINNERNIVVHNLCTHGNFLQEELLKSEKQGWTVNVFVSLSSEQCSGKPVQGEASSAANPPFSNDLPSHGLAWILLRLLILSLMSTSIQKNFLNWSYQQYFDSWRQSSQQTHLHSSLGTGFNQILLIKLINIEKCEGICPPNNTFDNNLLLTCDGNPKGAQWHDPPSLPGFWMYFKIRQRCNGDGGQNISFLTELILENVF